MGTQTVQQTTTTSLPEYAKPYYTSIMGQAQAIAARDYEKNPNQRVATFTQEQKPVREAILNQQTPGQFGQGSALAGLSGLGSLTAGDRYAQMAGPQSFTQDGTAQQYMSPYMQQVLDVQKQQAIRDAQQGQLAQNLGAARQGTYGGARQLLASTERERNLGTQLGQIQATGLQAAYDAAMRQFNAEQQAQMQNQQFGANLGLQGYAQAGQAGQTLGNLGSAEQQANLARLGMQQGTAAQSQDLAQRYLDINNADWNDWRNWEKNNLSWEAGLVFGAPMKPNEVSTTMAPSPSLGSQIMGAGLTGLSTYNMLKGP